MYCTFEFCIGFQNLSPTVLTHSFSSCTQISLALLAAIGNLVSKCGCDWYHQSHASTIVSHYKFVCRCSLRHKFTGYQASETKRANFRSGHDGAAVYLGLAADIAGYDIDVVPVVGGTDAARDYDCREKCDQAPSCEFWTRQLGEETCTLKKSFGGFDSDVYDVHSGFSSAVHSGLAGGSWKHCASLEQECKVAVRAPADVLATVEVRFGANSDWSYREKTAEQMFKGVPCATGEFGMPPGSTGRCQYREIRWRSRDRQRSKEIRVELGSQTGFMTSSIRSASFGGFKTPCEGMYAGCSKTVIGYMRKDGLSHTGALQAVCAQECSLLTISGKACRCEYRNDQYPQCIAALQLADAVDMTEKWRIVCSQPLVITADSDIEETPSSYACPCGHPVCGNGVIDPGEECDDANTDRGDGCSDVCSVEEGWTCSLEEENRECVPVCGDSLLVADEQCDDGNTVGMDGCDAECRVEDGWECAAPAGAQAVCSVVCGQGRRNAGKECVQHSLCTLAHCCQSSWLLSQCLVVGILPLVWCCCWHRFTRSH